MKEWNIGLSPWIIADGNYRNFHRRQTVEFALEFYPLSLKTTQAREKSVAPVENCRYKALAEVVFYSQEVWVLDFGLYAFNQSKVSSSTKLGDFVEVEFYLGIDPFFYFEWHYQLPGMLPLIYTWRLDEIVAQSAPIVGKWNAAGERWHEPDTSNYKYREVEQTGGKKYDNDQDALHDYYTTSLHYILNCTRLDITPKFQRAK